MNHLVTLMLLAIATGGLLAASDGAGAAGDLNCIGRTDGPQQPPPSDIDSDHLIDSCELAAGGSVGDPDTDDDGVLDGMEYYVGTNVNGGSGYPAGQDTDGDGCTNEQEKGSDPVSGGKRHPGNWWDFYEVTGNNSIDLTDTLFVITFFGREEDGSPGMHLISRLGPATFPPAFVVEMDTGADLSHALLSLRQFGHTCAAPPGPAPPNGGGIYN